MYIDPHSAECDHLFSKNVPKSVCDKKLKFGKAMSNDNIDLGEDSLQINWLTNL